MDDSEWGEWIARIRAGHRAEVAAALNLVEDRRPSSRAKTRELIARLTREHGTDLARRVGITGPPGVGKSSLLAALTRAIRAGTPPRTVGILAVDPTSIRSGGALLGDRVRIASDPNDAGIFVRSLATGGDLGGLARSVPLSVIVLGAAFDVVFVETVGVGQSETDVSDVVDTVVFVVQPGSGDALQFLKAGIMEVPDIFVVNKSDHAEVARRASADLHAAMSSLQSAGVRNVTSILSTSAQSGDGISSLVAAIQTHGDSIVASGERDYRRRAGAEAWTRREFVRRFGEVGTERVGGEEKLRGNIASAFDRGVDPLSILDSLAEPE